MLDAPPPNGRWIHYIETVYGAWPYGDPRGFRTRHHREHIEDDYKQPPPPDTYDQLLERSQNRLKQPPVVITREWRPIIGQLVLDRMCLLDAFVLCLAMSGQHLHLLAKLPPGVKPRDLMGLAKKHASFEVKSRGWRGELWGKRGKEIRVRSRAHQLNAYRYILDHEREGAWVWDWLRAKPTDGRPWA